MSAAGNWIVETTGAGTGGGPPAPAPPAPAVNINQDAAGAHPPEVRDLYDGEMEIRVYYTLAAAATNLNYKGVGVYLEDPDISAQPPAPMDGSVPLDGSKQLSGTWNPTKETDSTKSPVVLRIPALPDDRIVRVYLASYGPQTNSTPVRAYLPTPSPNTAIAVPAGVVGGVRGEEFTWLISNPTVETVNDFDNPNGPLYSLRFNFDEPDPAIPLPPGMQPYGGVQITYEYADASRKTGPFLKPHLPASWVTDEAAAVSMTFLAYFCSVDISGRVNTLVRGVTPSAVVTVVYNPAPPVTGLTIVPGSSTWVQQPDFTIYAQVDLSFVPADSTRVSAVYFYRTDVSPPRLLPAGVVSNMINTYRLDVNDYPATPANWTITAITADTNGHLSDNPNAPTHSPSVVWNVGPPTFTIPSGTAGAVTVEQEQGADGVQRMRFHIAWTNPPSTTAGQFGGMSIARVYPALNLTAATWWDAPLGATSLVTDWEPTPAARAYDFYFVSRDGQGHRNQIIDGVTPKTANIQVTPMTGAIVVSRLPTGWWNPAEFSWPAPNNNDGSFVVNQIVSQKLYVGSILRVGGGNAATNPTFAGFANGQIAVTNASNVLVAWMGQQNATATPGNPTPHSIFGGWFAELYIGGTGPPTAPIYANSAGTVIIGGWDVQGASYPYISIQDNTGHEVGRIGARIGQGISGAPDIPGAWFQSFAFGGNSLADWRLLAQQNLGTGLDQIYIRQVNNITLDWAINAPGVPTNPTNAPMSFSLGLDGFVADAANSSYWKFPGIKLVRTNVTYNQHGVTLINRGLVMNVDSSTGTQRRCALITWNGDQYGNDLPNYFWADLTMYSPTDGQPNVELRSGTVGDGSAYFSLTDQSHGQMFEVTAANGTFLRQIQMMVSGSRQTVINASGSYVGPSIVCTGSISAPSYLSGVGQLLINSSGQFVGPGISMSGPIFTSGLITGGSMTMNGDLTFPGANHIFIPSGSVGAGTYYIWSGSAYTQGAYGTFTSANGKTVTVSGGLITSIV